MNKYNELPPVIPWLLILTMVLLGAISGISSLATEERQRAEGENDFTLLLKEAEAVCHKIAKEIPKVKCQPLLKRLHEKLSSDSQYMNDGS